MVHIPFLNIEVPEVRLATLLPEAVTGGLRLASKAMDTAIRVTHPLPPQVEEAYVEEVLESFPREFQKVFRRGADGKHKNEDQLSSELEDASFDYYRRMIRCAMRLCWRHACSMPALPGDRGLRAWGLRCLGRSAPLVIHTQDNVSRRLFAMRCASTLHAGAMRHDGHARCMGQFSKQ